MNNLKLHGIWLLLILFVVSCNSTPQPNPRFTPYPEEAQILGLANDFRAQARTCGTQQFPAAPAMTWVEAIGDAAWFHSTDMGAANTENHVGASTEERLRTRGFDPGPAAENRARTNLPATASDAFNIWAANPAACANIMNPTFTVMGAGMWGQYEAGNTTNLAFWTQILAAPRGAVPAPTLTVSPTTATVNVGGAAIPFSATLTNSNATVNWSLTGAGSLSGTTGANVNYTPPATGTAGTATLTASAAGLTANATITINAAAPALTVTPTTATTTVGGANVIITASSNQITWSMTGPGTFSWVGETFTYIPPATGTGGTAVVTASLISGAGTASATITVGPPPSLTVSPTTATVTEGGAAIPFTATLVSSNATINWTLTGPGSLSSTTGTTVNYTPPATGGPTTATLTATAGALTASATITINSAAPSLTVSPSTATTQVGGLPTTITATLLNSNATINWSLTGPGSLSGTTGTTVSYKPPTTGTGGTATVTASAGALTATATFTINPPPNPDIAAFLTLINEFRSQPRVCMSGTVAQNMPAVPPVTFNALLNTAARLHSEDMATNNFFSHTGSNGSTFVTRIQATGYTGSPQGENIHAGSPGPDGAFNGWRNSTAGHCQAMMSANANEIGLGYGFNANSQWTHYWTFVSGKSN